MSSIMTMGEILVEIMATEVGQSLRRSGMLAGPYASGAPAIFIDQVAKLGLPCGIVACVGDDDFGRLNTDRLQADGVDTAGISVCGDAVTGSAFVAYQHDGTRNFIFNISNSAAALLGPERVTAHLLKDCGHFHVMGSSLFSDAIVAAMLKAVDIVQGQGGTISFDPNVRPEIIGTPATRAAMLSVLARCDIFLPSGPELTMLTVADDETAAVAEVLALGVREIVVKRGAAGYTYFDVHGRTDGTALRADEVDPTGAGDCFGATYVSCRHRGMAVEQALTYANASGALAIGRRGPMEGTATFAELDALLARPA